MVANRGRGRHKTLEGTTPKALLRRGRFFRPINFC
jgi:hypothetical protein